MRALDELFDDFVEHGMAAISAATFAAARW
jgi:hypothetical protein